LNISPDTINLCIEVLSQLGFTPDVPDAVDKLQRLVTALGELRAALPEGDKPGVISQGEFG
jgi:hypothetical protein